MFERYVCRVMRTISAFALAIAAFALTGMSEQAFAQNATSSRYIESALVETVTPPQKTHALPIIMVPGLNLASSIYMTTPDGRNGWATIFAHAGYQVHVINDPRFDFSRSPDVPSAGQPPQDPSATRPWGQDIWPRWGFGPRLGEPYPDARFPTDAFGAFEAAYPWVSTTRRDFQASIIALMEQVGPAILVAHSAGGPTAVSAAMARPDLVAAIVLVEPTGPPTAANFPTLSGKSLLGVYGDYIASRGQSGRKTATIEAADLFTQNGGHGEILDLVEDHNIRGNSHLMMQDNNNDFIASKILDWLKVHANPKPTGRPGVGRPTGPGRGKGKGKGMRMRQN